MKYFAYGSNMLLARLCERVPSAKALSVGSIKGHTLKFHKTSKDGSGKCDAFFTGGSDDILHGVIFQIPDNEKNSLDVAEGLGYGYEEKTVLVYSEVDQGEVEAITYYATDMSSELLPYHWYKGFVLSGAIENDLPEEYVDFIKGVESIADLDKKRTKLNEAILSNLSKKPKGIFGSLKGGFDSFGVSATRKAEDVGGATKSRVNKLNDTAQNTYLRAKDSVLTSKVTGSIRDRFYVANEISDSLTKFLKEKSSTLSSSISLTMLSQSEVLKITESITKSTATIYDKAMDMEYSKGHLGGGNHRLFDGSHTITGAWEKVAEASDNDSLSQEVIGYVSGMWKDVTTTKGLPFYDMDNESYKHYSGWVSENIKFPGVDKDWAYDLLSYDALEVFSVCVSSAAIVFSLKDNDVEKLSEILGKMSIVSVASANPLMMVAVVFFTAYSYFLHKNKVLPANYLSGAGGSAASTVTFYLLTILGAGFMVKIGFTIVASTLIKKKVIDSDIILALISEHKPDMSLLNKKFIKKLQISPSV